MYWYDWRAQQDDTMNNENFESKYFDCNRGCTTTTDEQSGEITVNYRQGCCKLQDYNVLAGILQPEFRDLFEVRFKNTRKGFYTNASGQNVKVGDLVIVEAITGYDLGIVTLEGPIVGRQMKSRGVSPDGEFKKIYRKARQGDIAKWQEAIAREQDTMVKARRIAAEMGLEMKIGDVEFQGDGSKAIFYYIADGRVDFRELIKVLADVFRVRIEMKQIGARQEAGRIGGIGPCGRELCCATFMSNFVSVSTGAARMQDLSVNPLKLAGQCAKIKCCVNYEMPIYCEAKKDFPRTDIPLETVDATYYHFKTDVFKRLMTYSSDKTMAANLVTISVDRAKEVIAANRRGEKVESLVDAAAETTAAPEADYTNVVGQDSLTRFDHAKNKRRSQNRNRRDRRRNNDNRQSNQ